MTALPQAQQAPLALSLQQQFLCLFAQGFEAGPFGPHYVQVDGWRLRGRVSARALRQALADVVGRHEALRTVVHLGNGAGTQSVQPAGQPELLVTELGEPAGRDRDQRAEQLMIETETRPFPARDIPLLRAVLGRFDDQDSVLVLSAHHAAADTWSAQVIMRDLARCYAARAAGNEPDLPPVTQYRDYIAAQQQEAAGPAAAASRAYWRQTLRGARILVTPARRDEQMTPATSYHRFVPAAHLRADVSRLATATRSSPFMILLAAFAVYLNQRTQATDIVVPTFAPGRPRRFQSTVGSFFNFVPLRINLHGCRTFRDAAARTRTACIGAFTHELPLLHLLADTPDLMASIRPDAVPCLFQAVQPPYMMHRTRIGDLEYTTIWRRVIPHPAGSETPDGQIWSMHLTSTEMTGGLSYSRHLFSQADIQHQATTYLTTLSHMLNNPDTAI